MILRTGTSSVLRDAMGTLAVRAAGILLMFVSTTLAARLLAPAEYGAYSASLALAILMASVAPFGTDRVLVRNLSTCEDSEHQAREIALTHVSALPAIVILMLVGVLLTLSGERWSLKPEWTTSAGMASILFLPLTLTYLRQWTAMPLIGTRRAVLPEQTIVPALLAVLLIASHTFRLSVSARGLTLLHAVILFCVWGSSLARGKVAGAYLQALKIIPNLRAGSILQRLKAGLPFISVAIGVVWTQSCVALVVAAACGFEEAAWFSLALPWAVLPAIPLGALNLSIISRCARHYHRGEFSAANHAVRSGATAAFASAVGIALLTWCCSPVLVMVLGDDYAMVRQLLPALLLAVLLDCLTGPTLAVMQTMGMERAYALLLLGYIPVQLAMNYQGGRIAGAEGVAAAYLLSRILWNIIVVRKIYQARGLLMLPYFRMLTALKESLPVEDSRRAPTGGKQAWARDVPQGIPESDRQAA